MNKKNQKQSSIEAVPLKTAITALVIPVVIMWVVEIIDRLLFVVDLDQFGISPRTMQGLYGIFLSPFLHASFAHTAANTIPFGVLGGFVILRGLKRFILVSLLVCLISGLGTWLIGGSNTVHVGASGVVFGYLGFIMGTAIFERSFVSIVLAAAAAGLYGGIIFGVLPGQLGISWEAHLFGFIGGIIAAKYFAKFDRKRSQSTSERSLNG